MTSQIINVIIVLAGIYIVLSVAASWLQDQFAAIAKLRASTLEKGIKELVSRDATVFTELSKHPLIASASSELGTQFPSYIDPRNFALAFWQSVGSAAAAAGQATQAIADPKVALAVIISDINAWNPASQSGKDVQRAAIALITSAQGDYDKLLKATESWYNAQMDRVSGWYKRNAQYILIVIAFALSFVFGVDSIDIGRQLYAAPSLADATAASISQTVSAHKDDKDPSAATKAVAQAVTDSQCLQSLRLFRWSTTNAPAKPSGNEPAKNASDKDSVKATPSADCSTAPPVPQSTGISQLLGMLITAIAVSLGAPFWFDLLKGLVNVRMAGTKPEAESSKKPDSKSAA